VINTIPKEITPPKEPTMLGRASISFVGSSANRIDNIKLGVERLDGKVVPAGEEFSFWKYFGELKAEDGFKEANSFLNGEIISGIGGGLCQISTTLFQSVVEAGLPITDRTNHSFSVSYYKTGLDATVSTTGPDLKFVNDTGYDITIKGYTEEDSAVFEIYGVYDERMASVSKAVVSNIIPPPPTRYIEVNNLAKADEHCEHSSQRGYTARVLYNVIYKDGTNKEQIFNSKYQPYAKICYISKDPITGCTSQTIYSTTTGIKCPTQ
jgi:vancomycin resistance protein YoaR